VFAVKKRKPLANSPLVRFVRCAAERPSGGEV